MTAFTLRNPTPDEWRELYRLREPVPPPIERFEPSPGQTSFWFRRAVVPFRRPLADAVVESLGRALGELLVARYRRDISTATP
jgi:hypothetical protein